MRLLRAIDRFFFAPVSATGFGLMRISWAVWTFLYLLAQAPDLLYFYSDAGVLPRDLLFFVTRDFDRFSVLEWSGSPAFLTITYIILMAALLATMLGIAVRFSTILSVVLVLSFHERMPLILGGGDTVLRHVGYILVFAPGIHAVSLPRLLQQWRHWRTTGELLPPVTMPIWPYRLLLWQMIIIYTMSFWYKSLGTMWWRGTAVAAVLHHPIFSRLPKWAADAMSPFGTSADIATMLFHLLWILQLVPRRLAELLPRWVPRIPLKRAAILSGVLFHGQILILMDAGSFSLMMLTAYIGLLLKEDFDALRAMCNGGVLRRWRRAAADADPKIAVLYDGRCGLCRRSAFGLMIIDNLHRLRLLDFRDRAVHKAVAADIAEDALDRALHIRFPGGRTLTGFDAFRSLAWHLPVLWPAAPLLYIPGVASIGRRIYARIADRRKRCSHEGCGL